MAAAAAAAAAVAAEEQNHNLAGPTRLCDRHCLHHHHNLSHGLGLCGGGGTRPRRRSRCSGGGCRPFRRSHPRPSDRSKDVRWLTMQRQCTTSSTPQRELVQPGRIAVCGDSFRHHCHLRRTFAVIVRAGIAPAFASAAMIFDNVGR